MFWRILFAFISGLHSALSGLVENQVEFVPGQIRKIDCDYIPLLAFKKMRSHLACSIWCSTWDECRRYMFCVYSDGVRGGCVLFKSYQECLNIKLQHPCICRVKKSLKRSDGNYKCYAGHYGKYCENVIQDCRHGSTIPAIKSEGAIQQLFVQPSLSVRPFQVFCSLTPTSTETFVLSRNYDSSRCNTPFNQTWDLYRKGFGRFPKGHWLGLTNLRLLTSVVGPNLVMRVVVKSSTHICEIQYANFSVGDESTNFTLSFGSKLLNGNTHTLCSETMGSGPLSSQGREFATYDRYSETHDCPNRMQSGWWFADDVACTSTNLNGPITPNANPRITYDPDFTGENIESVEIFIVSY